jgi:hypothetical protein
MGLGIVSANICVPSFPSLPQAVKLGFSFYRCICLTENNLPLGYNFSEGRLSALAVGKIPANFTHLG